MGVISTPKLELRCGSYYNSKLELNLTPLELNFNSFVELNSSFTMQGELNETILTLQVELKQPYLGRLFSWSY